MRDEITPAQAAAILGTTRMSVWESISRGTLPSRRCRRGRWACQQSPKPIRPRILIPRAAVVELARRRRELKSRTAKAKQLLVGGGMSLQRIAGRTGLSYATVWSIARRLGAGSR
jgi:DNA-directed RNA polymerase specialized sigma24 family protein